MATEHNTVVDAVYSSLSTIPAGKVCSYGTLARKAGIPGGARHIGRILKNLPPDTQLPWHRIVLSSGKLAFPEKSDHYQEQYSRLKAEGITFNGKTIPATFFMQYE